MGKNSINLIEAFESLCVQGINTKADKTIDVLNSKLFLYPKTVYKIYKYNQNFIGDFTSLQFRKNFYEEDFAWNREMSPAVYQTLHYVRFDGKNYVPAKKDQAQDFYIQMKRIDGTKNLTDLLSQDKVTNAEVIGVAREMTKKIQKLTVNKINDYQYLAKQGLMQIYLNIVESLRHHTYLAKDHIPMSRADEIVDTLKEAIIREPYFKNFDNTGLSINIDNQACNIIIQDGQIDYIDIFPPLDVWRVHDPFFVLSRGAVDVAVLKDEKHADLMHQEYGKLAPLGPDIVRKHYEVYSALTRAGYFFFLKRYELAKKYLNFVDKYFLLFK